MTAVQLRTFLRFLANEPDLAGLLDTTGCDYCFQAALEAFNRRVAYKYADDAAPFTFVAGTGEYAWPATAEEILLVIWNGRELKRTTLKELRSYAKDWRNRTGEPEEWYVYGRQVGFYPKPNAAAVSAASQPTLRYRKASGAFDDTELALIGSESHRVLADYAMMVWLTSLKSARPDLAPPYLQRFEQETALVAQMYGRQGVEK